MQCARESERAAALSCRFDCLVDSKRRLGQLTDTEAIALYVAAGNPREDWPNVDQCVRNYYLDLAVHPPRPMTGFLAGMTEEGKRRALEYDGPDGPIGKPPASTR
jgi:hypothetical protein